MNNSNQATQAGSDQAERIGLAQTYAECLQAGDESGAGKALQDINRLHGSMQNDTGSTLFQQVGQLTRELHDSMKHFMQDSQIVNLMQEDMPDARARLNHVIELTEKSAHDTMTAIEHSNPLIALLQQRAAELRQELQQITGRLKQEDRLDSGLGFLSDELDAFLTRLESDGKKIATDLNAIMMAQGYQDLTGQIIQRVISLVQDVEQNLVGLLQLGIESGQAAAKSDDTAEADRIGHGPAVPGSNNGRCASQDDVDDLLSTLGF